MSEVPSNAQTTHLVIENGEAGVSEEEMDDDDINNYPDSALACSVRTAGLISRNGVVEWSGTEALLEFGQLKLKVFFAKIRS